MKGKWTFDGDVAAALRADSSSSSTSSSSSSPWPSTSSTTAASLPTSVAGSSGTASTYVEVSARVSHYARLAREALRAHVRHVFPSGARAGDVVLQVKSQACDRVRRIDIVKGDLIMRDGAFVTPTALRFKFEGLYFWRSGLLFFIANPATGAAAAAAADSDDKNQLESDAFTCETKK